MRSPHRDPGRFPVQVSNQALQANFITFGDGYKFALPDDDYNDFGCTIPNGAYQVGVTAAASATNSILSTVPSLMTSTPA